MDHFSNFLSQDTEPVTSLAWGPGDNSLIIASRSLQLRLFSLEDGRFIRTFKVRRVSAGLCGRHLLEIEISLLHVHVQGHKAPVADMAIDGTQTLLATVSADRSVKVWDIQGGYCTHSFNGHRCGIV